MDPHSTGPAGGGAWLRHTLATLAYRAEKVLRDVPEDFPAFTPSPSSRSALATVAHLGDLLEWAERMTAGEVTWQPAPQDDWTSACDRFFSALGRLDAALAKAASERGPAEMMFQGPIADALTHVGQLAMMRGMMGAPVRPESYARAQIGVGHVGRDQSGARSEFDGDASPHPRTSRSIHERCAFAPYAPVALHSRRGPRARRRAPRGAQG